MAKVFLGLRRASTPQYLVPVQFACNAVSADLAHIIPGIIKSNVHISIDFAMAGFQVQVSWCFSRQAYIYIPVNRSKKD